MSRIAIVLLLLMSHIVLADSKVNDVNKLNDTEFYLHLKEQRHSPVEKDAAEAVGVLGYYHRGIGLSLLFMNNAAEENGQSVFCMPKSQRFDIEFVEKIIDKMISAAIAVRSKKEAMSVPVESYAVAGFKAAFPCQNRNQK